MKLDIAGKYLIATTIFSTTLSSIVFSATSSLAANSALEYRQLGLSYRQQGRYQEAINAMQKSVELEPDNINGRVNLGWTQHLALREEDAANSLLQAIYIKPLFVPSYNALGIVYLFDNKLVPALLTHTLAAIFKLDNEIAFYNLSLTLHRLGVYNLAIAAGNYAATLEPQNPHPFVASAISYWNLDKKSMANQLYRRAIKLDVRYKTSSFLNHLQQAAFSEKQISITKQISSNTIGKSNK
ncbi:MAG: tetratricopeptide repeat protein [Cyanobacteria bacterium P01_A01_bin.68]